MKRLLTEASLIMKPEGQADGLLPSVKPLDGSGDFTFSRGSNLAATRVNQAGLIEKGRENLLTYSNDFTNTAWNNFTDGVTRSESSVESPFGDDDTYSVIVNTGSNKHRVGRTTTIDSVSTFSIYAKANGYNYVRIWAFSGGNTNSRWFNLSDGTTGGAGQIAGAIESVGNNWYRCSVVVDPNNSGAVVFGPAPDESTASGTSNYTGDGISGIYVTRGQFEVGLAATEYIETTATTVKAGVLEDTPRLDYSGGATEPALLLEPQRTNIVSSMLFYSFNGVTYILSSTKIGEGMPMQHFTKTSVGQYPGHIITGQSISSGDVIAFSMFFKPISAQNNFHKIQMSIQDQDSPIYYDYSRDGFFNDVSGTPLPSNKYVEEYANGVYRIVHIQTSTASANRINLNIDSYYNTTSQFLCGYAQVEQDVTYPTSYIPTYGVSQTRLRDGITIPSSADLSIPSDSWTILWDISDESVATGGRWFDDNLQKIQLYPTAPNKSRVYWRGIGQYIASAGGSKIIARYDGTTATEFHDGVNKGSASYSGQLPFDFYTALGAGSGKYIFNKFIIFPTALTDSECIELTTI